jgi:hypothetical protein
MSQVKNFFMLPTLLPIVNCSVKLEVIFCVQAVISPLLSNLYLTEVDRMLEKAIETTRRGPYTHVQYTRFADGTPVQSSN